MTDDARVQRVRELLFGLQDQICLAFEQLDALDPARPAGLFDRRELNNERGGTSRPRVLSNGAVLERAAINATNARGPRLPPAATEQRLHLADRPFEAISLSLITHPRNPFVPTCHANLRCFLTFGDRDEQLEAPTWWFGGGFDLTPVYGFEDDARLWHEHARAACLPFGETLYPHYKKWCDDYFYLPHRQEARGIGGIFFDDLSELPGTENGSTEAFDRCADFVGEVGRQLLEAYSAIVARRWHHPYGEEHRSFQRYRRGRYAEFNLALDRGTRYGLQAGARAESVLASLPPTVEWRYDWKPEPGSEEARLTTDFLPPRDWLEEPA